MSEEKYKDLPAKKTADMPTGLYWKGKKTEVDRVVLPFQTIETINESRATREREKKVSIGLFKPHRTFVWVIPIYCGHAVMTWNAPSFLLG